MQQINYFTKVLVKFANMTKPIYTRRKKEKRMATLKDIANLADDPSPLSLVFL